MGVENFKCKDICPLVNIPGIIVKNVNTREVRRIKTFKEGEISILLPTFIGNIAFDGIEVDKEAKICTDMRYHCEYILNPDNKGGTRGSYLDPCPHTRARDQLWSSSTCRTTNFQLLNKTV